MTNLLNRNVQTLTTKELVATITLLDKEYRAGNPLVSDDDYDHVYVAELQRRDPQHPLLLQVQPSTDVDSKGLIKHPEKMLSADKAYTRESVQKWLNRAIKKGKDIGLSPSEIIISISSKYDGIAGRRVAKTQQVITRGTTGEAGNDLSHMVKNGLKVVGDINSDAIGEIAIKNKYFDENYSKEAIGEDGYVESRSFISGIANSIEISDIGLKALKAGHIELLTYKAMPRAYSNAAVFMDEYEALESQFLISEYKLDGVIFDIENEALKKALGANNHHPIWRLAKKQVKGAKPVSPYNIKWQVGRTRAITPVLQIPPTTLAETTVTSITGHSLGYILKHGLGVGSTFLAHKAGQVIPAFLESLTKTKPDYPKACPVCEEPTTIEMGKDKEGEPCEHLKCSNPQCEGSGDAQLEHAIKRLGIDNFGPAACKKLTSGGVMNLKDLLSLSRHDFLKLGFGPGETDNFLKEFERIKSVPIKDSSILASLGIHLLGRRNSEKLLSVHRIERLAELTFEQIESIKGFAEISANATIGGVFENKEILDFLLSYGFTIIHSSEQVRQNESHPLYGQYIVFTGTMESKKRSEFEEEAKKMGALVQKSINTRSNLLVCGAKTGAKKTEAARNLGVEIIDEKEYNSRFLGLNRTTNSTEH